MTRTVTYLASHQSEPQHEYVSFGLTDARGRAVGARLTRYEFTATRTDEAVNGSCMKLPEGMEGRVYAFAPQATRDGAKYGALQPHRFFPTYIEREAAVVAYLRKSVNRAAKQFPVKQEG